MFQAQLYEVIAKEHSKDLLRQAEGDRLAHLASASEEHHHWHCRALAFIGSKLIEWGNRLQKH